MADSGINLGKAYVQIIPSAKGITGSISKALSGEATSAGKSAGKNISEATSSELTKEAPSIGKGVGSKIASAIGGALKAGAAVISTGFKAATAGLSIATGAVSVLGKSAIESYASYEQLVGGVDKLYGDASDKLQAFADQAYKTSGLSANTYMETATSFSASLINSLGGDVDAAAELTDVAMRAMSDNVNVFGSDFQSVQNAFQGFAKQNYTMLDNLKLGYGGTKEEMQRLIADANEYRASIGQSADLSIDSFADVVQAIQSIQEAQHIAGTTGKEAMTTIEGSAATTKAAWANVITAIGRGEGLSEAMDGLMTSLFGENEGEGLINNILPRISIVMESIGEFIGKAAPILTEKVPEMINATLPTLLTGGMQLLQALTRGFLDALPDLIYAVGDAIEMVLNAFAESTANSNSVIIEILDDIIAIFEEAYPELINVGFEILTNIMQGMMAELPALLDYAQLLLIQFAEAFIEYFPVLVSTGMEILTLIIDGINEHLPELITIALTIITMIIDAITTNAPTLISAGMEILTTLVNGVMQNLPMIVTAVVDILNAFTQFITDNLPELLDAGLEMIEGLMMGIMLAIPRILPAIIELVTAFTDFIVDNIDKVIDVALKIIETLADGILKALPILIPAAIDIIMKLVDKLTDPQTLDTIINAAVDIIMALADGIIDALPKLIPAVISIIIKITERLLEPDMIGKLVDASLQIILALAAGLIKALPDLIAAIPRIIVAIVNAILEALPKIFKAGAELLQMFKQGIIDNVDKLVQAGKDLVDGLWQGISDKWGDLVEGALALGESFIDVVKWIFGIASPSKKFAEIGRYCVEGFDKEFEDFGEDALADVQNSMDKFGALSAPDLGVNVNGFGDFDTTGNGDTTNNASININVYGAEGQDEMTLAQMVADVINQQIFNQQAVFA